MELSFSCRRPPLPRMTCWEFENREKRARKIGDQKRGVWLGVARDEGCEVGSGVYFDGMDSEFSNQLVLDFKKS